MAEGLEVVTCNHWISCQLSQVLTVNFQVVSLVNLLFALWTPLSDQNE